MWSDLACYAAGVGLGILIELAARRRGSAPGKSPTLLMCRAEPLPGSLGPLAPMNAAYLVINNSPRPAGETPAGKKTYDRNQVVAKSNLMLPILWLSLYDEADLVGFESVAGAVLSPVTTLRKARLRWRGRRPLLEETFPHNATELDGWEQAIARLKARYIKIDAEELWMLGRIEEAESRLRAGVRWFEGGDGQDFRLLLDSLWMRGGYDPSRRLFTEENVPYYFYGEPWDLPPLKADWGV